MYGGDLPPPSLALLQRHPSAASPLPMRRPVGRTPYAGFRNIDRIVVGYASRPHPGGIILAREPLDLRCAGFSPAFSHTHASILVSDTSSGHRHPPSQAYGTLSYHSVARVHDFGDVLSPDHFRRGVA